MRLHFQVVTTAVMYLENCAAAILLSPLVTLTDVDNTDSTIWSCGITGRPIPGDGDTLTVGGSTSGTTNGITFLWHAADSRVGLYRREFGRELPGRCCSRSQFHSTHDNPTDFNAAARGP